METMQETGIHHEQPTSARAYRALSAPSSVKSFFPELLGNFSTCRMGTPVDPTTTLSATHPRATPTSPPPPVDDHLHDSFGQRVFATTLLLDNPISLFLSLNLAQDVFPMECVDGAKVQQRKFVATEQCAIINASAHHILLTSRLRPIRCARRRCLSQQLDLCRSLPARPARRLEPRYPRVHYP